MKVSILLTAYNYGAYIARALDSALMQSMDRGQFEVLVVDDGSTDETPEILKEFGDSVRVLRQSNQGLAAACNTGIEASQGEYLIRLDADDEIHSDSARLCSQILDTVPDVALVYTDRIDVDVANDSKKVHRVGDKNIYDVIAPGIMFRKHSLVDVGAYNNLYWEEHDLMIRLLKKNESHYLSQPLYVYYIHGSNMTSNAQARRDGWEELIGKWGIDELRHWGTDEEMETVYAEMAS